MLKKEDVLELLNNYSEYDDDAAEVVFSHRFDDLADSIIELSNEAAIVKVHSIKRVQDIQKGNQSI